MYFHYYSCPILSKRIPGKASQERSEREALIALNAAKAAEQMAKAEREAREFAVEFAKKAKIFALEQEGKSRRLGYFGTSTAEAAREDSVASDEASD